MDCFSILNILLILLECFQLFSLCIRYRKREHEMKAFFLEKLEDSF